LAAEITDLRPMPSKIKDLNKSVLEEVPAIRGNLKKRQVYYYEMKNSF
jgi:hypothetical protein